MNQTRNIEPRTDPEPGTNPEPGTRNDPRNPEPRTRNLISWPLLTLVLSIIPIAGVFTLSRVFFVRDLTLAFRPRFLFLRHSMALGTFPLWDPYAANGQPAIGDALYQLFHVPSLALRLLLPRLIAYNAWVAAPVPLAAAGMYLFLRKHVTPVAAAVGGLAYGISGPMVSSTNFPNLSWSIAAVPFVFWSLERLFERRSAGAVTVVAVCVSCQALAGEPVTLAATGVIAGAYVVFPRGRWRDVRLVAAAAIGLISGILLSAIQYVPLAAAVSGSARNQIVDADFWTFHPLALVELVVPHFFGDYFTSNLSQLSWMTALNSGRDPFYYSMYIGVLVAFLAAVAMISWRPGTRFWTVVAAACVLASLGAHTPFYPLVQVIAPPVRAFRFPVKYLSLAAFAIATLAATSFQWTVDGRMPRRAVRVVVIASAAIAVMIYAGIAWLLISPAVPIRAVFHLAQWVKVSAPVQGAEFLLYRARPLLTALFLKLIAGSFLLWLAASARRERRTALIVFSICLVVDLLASNSGVNPTTDPRIIDAPDWVQKIPPDSHQRVYVGGRLDGYVNVGDEDGPKYIREPDRYTLMEQRHTALNEFLVQPSAARIRESMSYDLPVVWPLEYTRAHSLFTISSRAARLRFLERVGTRYVMLPAAPSPGAVPLAQMVGAPQMHLYDLYPQARRATIVPDALMGPGVDWQVQGMFLERFHPADGVLVSEPPPPISGIRGPAVPAAAEFVDDGLNRVVIRAGLPYDGYLVLFDSYNPDWHVDVDGAAATLMRGDGLFRAVHLTRGTHLVTFSYRPRALYVGAAITAITALALAAACLA